MRCSMQTMLALLALGLAGALGCQAPMARPASAQAHKAAARSNNPWPDSPREQYEDSWHE